jgi:hypothetical protein
VQAVVSRWQCTRCSTAGVYVRTEVVYIGGRARDIDPCLATIVRALNSAGVETVASCCGHGRQPGSIVLADGRELLIRNYPGEMRCGT